MEVGCIFSREELYSDRTRLVVEEIIVPDGFLPAFVCAKCGYEVAQHFTKLIPEEREESEKGEDSE